jgi:hypothetical protein
MTYDIYRCLGLDSTYWLGDIDARDALEALEAADRLFGQSEHSKLVVAPRDTQEGVSRR